MRATSKWASVYFVVLMIIGNYILFNLLVAILVEGFSTETVSQIYITATYDTIFSFFLLRLISSSILLFFKFFLPNFFFFCYSTFSFFSWNKFILLIQRKLLQLHVIFDIFFKNSDQKWFRCFYFYFVTMNSISIAEKLNGFYCNIIDTPVVKRRVIKLEFFRRGFFHHQQNLLWYTLLHQSIKKKNRFVFMTKTKPVHYQIFLMSNTITLQKITSKFH